MCNDIHPFPNVPFSHKTSQQLAHQMILFLKDFCNSLLPRLLPFVKFYQSFKFRILIDHFPFVHQRRICWELEAVLIVWKETLHYDLCIVGVLKQICVDSRQYRDEFSFGERGFLLLWLWWLWWLWCLSLVGFAVLKFFFYLF